MGPHATRGTAAFAAGAEAHLTGRSLPAPAAAARVTCT